MAVVNSGVYGNENAINNERRIHELLNVIESSGKFHETIKSESPADEQMMIVRSGERVSDSDIESGRLSIMQKS